MGFFCTEKEIYSSLLSGCKYQKNIKLSKNEILQQRIIYRFTVKHKIMQIFHIKKYTQQITTQLIINCRNNSP